MKNKFDNLIFKADEMGDYLIDNFVKPILKGTVNILIDEKLKYYLTFKTAFMENKISIFLKSIQDDENIDIKFIEDMNDNENVFFTQTINKVIDLDDSLQIYILSYLTKQYMKNKELSYYEKQLYYNIDTFTNDDFEIFYSMYKENKLSDKHKRIRLISLDKKKEILDISLKKFSNIGLLNFKITFEKDQQPECFEVSDYSRKLYDCLCSYQDDLFNKTMIEKKLNTIKSFPFVI
ncbi:MAG: hypothetical protein COA39_000170 [Sulfurimonas sp.]|nr:hypothetical protein [Sulfurimonas sp.]